MTLKKIIIASVLALGAVSGATLGVSSAALAQSAYTTGTIASDEQAGLPSVEGNGTGLYAYAPRREYSHAAANRLQERRETQARQGKIDIVR
jgi:hypothetical protein